MSHEGGAKAVVAAAAANTAIALLKLGGWALTGASSMLAEAIHSFADTGNQALLLVGGRRSRRAATAEHPFGYGRERYVSGFLVSIVLFSLGGLFALYEAWHKLGEALGGHRDPLLESRWWWVPLVILGGAIVAEGLSFRTAIREANRDRGSRSWTQYVRGAKAPELPVVLLEDSAALLGLVFALLGVGLTKLTGNGVFDAVGTGMIGLLLVAVAVALGVEMQSLLVGEAASTDAEAKIRAALAETPGVSGVIHLKTLHLGPDEVLVAAKIAVDPTDSAQEVAAAIDAAERRIRAAEPLVTDLYLEPDIYRPDYRPDPRPGDGPEAGPDAPAQ